MKFEKEPNTTETKYTKCNSESDKTCIFILSIFIIYFLSWEFFIFLNEKLYGKNIILLLFYNTILIIDK